METMKSMFFACALLLGSAEAFSAENLVLSEDFESQIFPPSGWIIKGTELSEDLESGYAHWSLNWNEVTGCSIAGSGCAEVMSDFKEGQAGISKEEWLITPAVQVADNVSLFFTFWCNASSFMTNKYGSFLVKVSTDDGDTWSDLWNAASQEDIENSGLTWPWNKDAMGIENNWQKLTPNVSLEAYVGKTVKIAFYFRSILVNNYTQATLAVDNVKVGNQEIENLPVVEGSTSYEFSNSYIGYLAQSEPMTIRNVGYGTLTITSIEGIEGTDFSTTLDPASVSLKRGEELSYRVNYTPTITGAKSTVMKINTNGGTLSVDLSGTKVMLEEGYTLESFEGDIFPPAGWSRNEGWKTMEGMATSGVKSVTVGGMMTCDIVSPRLDLSAGNGKVKFDYIETTGEEYIDDSFLPSTYFILYYKKNTDTDWTPLAYTQDRTKWRHKYVSLADYAGKSVNMRWRFVATENAGVSSGGASLDEIFVGDIKDMPTLAVSEIKKENLTVYPNPTSDYIYWAGGKADVKVYDLAGNCIRDLTEVESVSLEGLASGMYIVSVSCGDSVSTARVMKR